MAKALPTDLRSTAKYLTRRERGILAADESVGTIGKRLIAHNLPNDESTRRQWREILLCAPGNEQSLSGAILFHETFYQNDRNGVPFIKVLTDKGILPGIKVDTGLKPVESSEGETFTSGLEGLEERCKQYRKDGARFTKWRAALRIDEGRGLPTEAVVSENADTLARYAKVAQQCDLVPIVEPEILIDGDHSQAVSAKVARIVIKAVFEALQKHDVDLETTLLKPMMILPGVRGEQKVTSEQVAKETLAVVKDSVPPQVPGVMFLSGGMSEVEATENLAALNRLADEEGVPWTLSFSFGRALQSSAMNVWAGKEENVKRAMDVATALAVANGAAQVGKVDSRHPGAAGGLYEWFRGWRTDGDPQGV